MCEGVTGKPADTWRWRTMGLTVWKKGRLNIQQEVGEKEESTIVTLQLCTINRISTHTHTHIHRFFLHVSAWHPHTHRKATYVIQSGIFLLCFQVYGKEPKHTHTEKSWWALVQGKELRWNAHKHTLWAGQPYKPMGRLRKTTAYVCVFWVQREVVMTGRRRRKKKQRATSTAYYVRPHG